MIKVKQKICVIGMGYIGLPTAAILATYGYQVMGIDNNKRVINNLKNKKITTQESELVEMVTTALEEENLQIDSQYHEADIFIITVPTPLKENKTADMSLVIEVVSEILGYLKKENILIIESTCKVGTTEKIIAPMLEQAGFRVGEDIYLGYCPERVLPGNIIKELKSNNRIIGGINNKSAVKIREIYTKFVEGEIMLTDTKTAETCKLVENTFRDINIAYANEIAKICGKIEINVWEVIELCNKHPRVNIQQPGPGVGGHCLAVDPYFLVEECPEEAKLIQAARKVNDAMPEYIYEIINDITHHDIRNREKITLLGIAYKANSDDIRESPMIKLVEILEQNNWEITVIDQHVERFRYLSNDILEACKESSLLVLGVNHKEFDYLPLEEIQEVMTNPIILDIKNQLDKKKVQKAKLIYRSL